MYTSQASPTYQRPPPRRRLRPLARRLAEWTRRNLFSSVRSGLLTVLAVVLLVTTVPEFIAWAFVDSIWQTGNPIVCKQAEGACWAVITEKHRFMLFGVYSFEEQWRPAVAIVIYISTVVVSCLRRFWRARVLLPLWTLSASLILGLMLGGFAGLPYMETDQWGGLPLTIILFTSTIFLGIPLGVLLALGRRSRLPVIRILSVTLIEGVRALPLITIIFCAAVLFPLFLPQGIDSDKVVRIAIGLAIFHACYQAEVVRGGLQAIPKGQYEAAQSIGLGYWSMTRRVILPQALRIVIPGLMNQIISSFKDTTLVIIVGLFDLLTAMTVAVGDPEWRAFFTEAYIFVSLVYLSIALSMSRYSQNLERTFRGEVA
jgi:general L-amino acid transport system permease protein